MSTSLIRKPQCMVLVIPLKVRMIDVEGIPFMGIEIDLPNSPPLILIKGRRGFAMCGFLNMDAAEKVGVTAITSSGVNSIEDLLNAKVKGATSKALERGVKLGDKVAEALIKIESE